MNSLNIITARVSPNSSTAPSRSNSITQLSLGQEDEKLLGEASPDENMDGSMTEAIPISSDAALTTLDEKLQNSTSTDETPLLGGDHKDTSKRSRWWHSLPRHIATSIISSIRWILATIASPGVYLMAWFCDDSGNFAPTLQARKLFGAHNGHAKVPDTEATSHAQGRNSSGSKNRGRSSKMANMHHHHQQHVANMMGGSSISSSSTSSTSDSETEISKGRRRQASRASNEDDDDDDNNSNSNNPNRRSIRIKLNNDEAMRERKHQRTQSQLARLKNTDGKSQEEILAQIKSPTSPSPTSLTKYPKTPAPPRPLIPRRQPSYLNVELPPRQQKTLILDLDETLIHSMSKGGRMSTGHMVEVRLNSANLGAGQSGLSQHPILYWVNKRPYCDEFLRRVCKWFNLVIFTASVQEYADPVIDWLEQERKFFSARYYRQHCTFRQGAYIKDLSSVEPDLSNVMILDNSPLSYLFHEDNAIPIQGWISDPTDNDLMHLVPLLEGLQYVHDVRAFLALRGGEDGSSNA